jgi:DnaJ-class molecular chaperone
MAKEEAYRILGLKAGASDEDIKAAYRRLMGQMHPDHGGSDYLAAKINQAKDMLLKLSG